MKKSTKLFSLIVAIMMLISVIPMNVFALELTTGEAEQIESTEGTDEQIQLPEETAEDCVAVIDGVEYTDFVTAIKLVAENGGTLILCKDVTLSEKITINGDVKIIGDYTITRGYAGTLFAVSAGASLTLDGGLTLNGANEYAFDKSAYEADLNAYTTITDGGKYFTVQDGAIVATAYMITTASSVTLGDITIKNNYSKNSGIISAIAGANVILDGAYITHCANVGGSGLVVNSSASVSDCNAEKATITMNEGTIIDGNHVGGNHGVFKIYSGTLFTMNGGEIKNTTGCNSNGTVVGIYNGKFILNGGTICSNSSVKGSSNGRNASIYVHNASIFIMNDGIICHNIGAYGGIDSPKSNSVATINGGYIVNNESVIDSRYFDINPGTTTIINGGVFTQDVSNWLSGSSTLEQAENGSYIVTSYAGYQARIGSKGYTTLQQAIAEAKNGETIILVSNITLDADDVAYYYGTSTDKFGLIHVSSDKSITLDLNGFTIESEKISTSARYDVLVNEGELTIIDSATVKGAIISGNTKDNLKVSGGFAIINFGKATLNGVTIKGYTGSYVVYTEGEGATLDITDCTISGRGAVASYNGAVATINSGSFAIDVQTGNSQDNVVCVYNGTAIINGGSFDGTLASGASCAVCPMGDSTVIINGGEFIAKSYDVQSRNTSVVTINGGSFTTGLNLRNTASIKTQGGMFTYMVEEKYCADGFKCVDNGDGTYGMAKKTTPVINDIVINLNYSLSIKFIINEAEIIDGYYVVIEHENHKNETRLAISELTTENGAYVVLCSDIVAKEMVDNVTATVYNENGEAVSTSSTSIREYAMALLETTDNDSLKTLIVDTLNYGSATQEYLGYKTNDLANAYLTEEQRAYATEYVQSVQPLPLYDSVNLYGTSLSVRDTFTLKFYFKNVTSDMTATVSMSNGTSYEIDGSAFKTYKNGIMIIDVDSLTVYDAGEMVECVVRDADGNIVASAVQNIANYLTSMVNKKPENSVYEYILKYITAGNMYEEQ